MKFFKWISTGMLLVALGCGTALAAQVPHEVIVSTDGNGAYATVSAALAVIVNNSESNPYRITVKPGIYVENFTMKPYVDVVGSGQDNTTITGTITWDCNGTLENLKLKGTMEIGGGTTAITGYETIRSVTVEIPSSADCGIRSSMYGRPLIYNSKVLLASGTNDVIGIVRPVAVYDSLIDISSAGGVTGIGGTQTDAIISNTSIMASAGTFGYGMMQVGEATTVSGCRIKVTAGSDAAGIDGNANITIRNSQVSATTGNLSSWTFAVGNWSGNTVTADSSSFESNMWGVYVDTGSGAVINNSTVSGGVLSFYKYDAVSSFKVGSSKIVGAHNGGPSDRIINCYDGSYAPIANQ